MNYVFFGTPDRAQIVLETMAQQGWLPTAIVTNPDQPVGRKQIVTESEVSAFGRKHNIPTFKPGNKNELLALTETLADYNPDLFLVVAYGMIMPQSVLDIPHHGAINIHYSLLPRWRGASPVVQQILHNEPEVGLTVMKMIAELDAGPIYHQQSWPMPDPLPTTKELADFLSYESGEILPSVMEQIVTENIVPTPQDDTSATYCHKIQKSDGEISLTNNGFEIYKKTKAYFPWPKTYFFVNHKNQQLRVVINDVDFSNNQLQIVSVTPAGKSTMTWQEFTSWLGHDPLTN